MKKNTLYLMIITLIISISSFIREIVLSYFFGASSITDAYLLSLTIPTVIFEFITAGLIVAYIPLYNRVESEEGKEKAEEYTNNLVNILMLFVLVVFAIGILMANVIVRFIASGFDEVTLNLAVAFTRISLTGMFFNTLVAVFSGYLQVKGNYVIPALVALPMNIIVIISIYISSGGNIYILAIGTAISFASQLILMVPVLRKKGYKHRFILNFRDKNLKRMLLLVAPIVIGVSVNQINILVDRSIASSVAVGGISALNYAKLLLSFVRNFLVLSVITVSYPILAKMVVENQIQELKKITFKIMNVINLFNLPVSVGLFLLAEPIIRAMFGRGAFDERAVLMTSVSLFFFSFGIIGMGVRDIVARVFYAMHDTKTPLINATIGIVLNIILNIVLSRIMGLAGIALATSIGATFTGILLLISLRRKIGSLNLKSLLHSFVKMLIASLGMGVVVWLTFSYLSVVLYNQYITLAITIGVGAIVYFGLILVMRIEEVDSAFLKAKEKLLKRKK